MALTDDEINEILEFHGRGYSGRKIADKTEHSSVTIYYHIRRAKERVINLITEGMDTEQVLSQLGYPVSFVNRVIGETDVTRITEEKGKSKVEEFEEGIESSHGVDIRVEYDDFKKDLELEQRKDHILERVMEFLEHLRLSEERFRQRSVFDVEFQKRQSTLGSKLEDFVLNRIGEIDNMDVLSDLEIISEDVFRNINTLINEYNIKADQVEKARKAQEKTIEDARIAQEKAHEKALSNGLLDGFIDIPMFPDFVKKGIRSKFLVRFPYEASIIRDALFQINLEIMQEYGFIPDHNEEAWQASMDKISSGGGDYIEKLASKYKRDMVNSLVSIDVCPSCESKLSRRYTEGRTFVDCSSCARSYEILKE